MALVNFTKTGGSPGLLRKYPSRQRAQLSRSAICANARQLMAALANCLNSKAPSTWVQIPFPTPPGSSARNAAAGAQPGTRLPI